MINDINSKGINKADVGQLRQQAQAKADDAKAQQAQPQAAAKSVVDSVNITPQARQLHSKAAAADSFDSEKVDKLKKAIASGQYQVNYDKLAEKLSQFEFDLYG